MPHLKSLKIKTNLLAITGRECITSTGAFGGIKMLTSYLQSLQLNVNKFSTCTYKLQIGYIIITTQVTKLSPNYPQSLTFLQPLTAAVVPTIGIEDYIDHQRTQQREITESM